MSAAQRTLRMRNLRPARVRPTMGLCQCVPSAAQDQRRLSFPCAFSILRSTPIACLTSGMAMPQCNRLPSRRVDTTPADLSIAKCCERFAFEIPSPSCSSEAQRPPRVSISTRCRRVELAKALQITACRSKTSCSPLDFCFVATGSPETRWFNYLASTCTDCSV